MRFHHTRRCSLLAIVWLVLWGPPWALAESAPQPGTTAQSEVGVAPGDPQGDSGRAALAGATPWFSRIQPQGLHAVIVGEGPMWKAPSLPGTPDRRPLSDRLLTPPSEALYVSPYFEPVLLTRLLYVTTREDAWVDNTGRTRSSTELRRTFLGHREGFVLENVEMGFRGRINDIGLHYGVVIEWVPREKDGTKSESDFLKEVWVGWNYFSVADLQAGRIKLPISRANLLSTATMPLVYKPLLDTLLPKRLIGASLALTDPWKVVRLQGGVFNTSKEAHEQLADPKYLMYAARLELNVDRLLDAIGVATGDFFDLSLGGSYAWTEENYDPRTELRYTGFDARLKLYIFEATGELLLKDYYGEGTQAGNAYRGIGWHFDLTTQVWPSVLDLMFRIEEADNNTEMKVDFAEIASMAVDQKKRWLTFGVKMHLARQVDIAFNYVLRQEREGRTFDNDMFLSMLQIHL